MDKLSPPQLVTCLWFDGNAAEAAAFYVSVFPNSKVTRKAVYPSGGEESHKSTGKDLTVDFELNGHKFVGLNGGSHFKFTPATSFQIMCDTQDEIDHYWDKLGDGGDPSKQQCGWVEDKFGVSWQVVPTIMPKLLAGEDRDRASRAMAKMMGMKKLDVKTVEEA